MGNLPRATVTTGLVPPDGGWGWIIVVAYAMCNIVVTPSVGSFGLIFADKFVVMNISATDVSLITNVNAAFAMSMGLISGSLLRKFGYRKVGFASGVLVSVGLTWTAFATTFAEFMVFYGLLTASGFGLSLSSFSLALNSYFKEKRNKAVGIGMTLTGLGPIFYPPLISVLLAYYGVTGCVLLLGGMCLHILAGALLLQPVKWHMKRPSAEDVEVELLQVVDPKGKAVVICNNTPDNVSVVNRKIIEADHCVDAQSIYGIDHMTIVHSPSSLERTISLSTIASRPMAQLPSRFPVRGGRHFERSISHVLQRPSTTNNNNETVLSAVPTNKPLLRWFESGSVESVHLGSSVDVFSEDSKSRVSLVPSSAGRLLDGSTKRVSVNQIATHPEQPQDTSEKSTCGSWLVRFFDLDLFRDSTYVNIMLGMSLAIFAELNFAILTPFIFNDFGYTSLEIASFLSVLAVADIGARFCAPFVGDRFRQPPRVMYMFSLVMLIVTRMSILTVSTYESMMVVCVGLGLAKGIRTVYMYLVIPSHVPIERLAAASGLQMVVNGLVIMALGPFVGIIRDWSGSYTNCILFLNVVTCVTLTLWSVEFACKSRHRKRQQRTVRLPDDDPLTKTVVP